MISGVTLSRLENERVIRMSLRQCGPDREEGTGFMATGVGLVQKPCVQDLWQTAPGLWPGP